MTKTEVMAQLKAMGTAQNRKGICLRLIRILKVLNAKLILFFLILS